MKRTPASHSASPQTGQDFGLPRAATSAYARSPGESWSDSCWMEFGSENEGLHGFTATAVCSICADPPTVLIAVNRSARTHAHISRRQSFVVNVMADDQQSIAERFSTKDTDPFSAVPHLLTDDGVPGINGTSAFLECVVREMSDVGTHTIFIGSIVNAGASDKAPLLYHDGKYNNLNVHKS